MSFFYTEPVYKDPNQLELELKQFWPLTEQIPLEMSYEGCDTQTKTIQSTYPLGDGYTFYPTGTWAGVGTVTIKAKELTIETPNMPWYRKLAFKLLGFKWE